MSNNDRGPRNESKHLTDRLRSRSRRRRETLTRLQGAMAATGSIRNDLSPPLVLVSLSIDALRAPRRKVRALDEAHVAEIVRAISALGFCLPVLIGKEDVLLDGRSRVEAAKRLGLTEVPCIRVEHLSNDEQRLLSLALNRLGEKGRWDLAELKIEFEELILADTPIELSGFGPDEIDQIVLDDQLSVVEVGPLAPEPDAVAVARSGDMFLLGKHRFGCGDATDVETWRRLMGADDAARLLLTDEPYNVPIRGHASSSGHREFAMASGEMSDGEYLAFNISWIGCALPWLRDGAVFGTFIDWRGYPTAHAASIGAGLAPLNLVVWSKTNAGMGSLYRSRHELLPLFKKGSAPHVNNVDLGRRGRWRSNVWPYPGASSRGSDARAGLRDHPTVKPVAMLEDALLDLTNRGDLVLDPFLGSGSMLIACERTGRVCRGLELDPLYADVIIRRFEAASGTPAILAETGERFGDLVARRRREAACASDDP